MDEVHRAGANMHQKVMEYFKPKLYLGMTASPERTDNFDIFSLFDHNVAYEIRLNQALEEVLLCPFHYFGISDIAIDEFYTTVEYDYPTFHLTMHCYLCNLISEEITLFRT